MFANLPSRTAFGLLISLGLLIGGTADNRGLAQQAENATPPAAPTITLRYLEVRKPNDFRFRFGEVATSKPIGEMAFEYPAGSFPVQGIAPDYRTYCAEPLVPIRAGTIYNFRIDPINLPEFYGLPDTAEGRAQAEKRASYIRELYGRYYQETLTTDRPTKQAFQAALWEVIQEKDLPAGVASPFNLFAGQFRADYPTEAESPEYAQIAQKYVQSLNGDDSSFLTNPTLAGQQLIRLTGLPTADMAAPQSQIGLRGVDSVVAGGPGGAAPVLGMSSMLSTGIPTGSGNLLGANRPLGGVGGIAPGIGGAGAGGFPFLGQPFAATSDNTPAVNLPPVELGTSSQDSQFGPSTQGPAVRPPASTDPSGDPTQPLPPIPNDPNNPNNPNNPTNNPNNPVNPGDPNNPNNPTNNPVPAPPAVVLGLIGLGVLGLRHWKRSRGENS